MKSPALLLLSVDYHRRLRCTASHGLKTRATADPSGIKRFQFLAKLISVRGNCTGNDANDGLSADRPVQTLVWGIALLRDHSADQLLLKRGDTWNSDLGVWRKCGKSGDQPMLIGAYGSGDRSLLLTVT